MPANRSVLVTGASGFIGSALCKALRARGDSVIALSRNRRRAQRALGTDVEVVASLDQIAATRVIDAVVNLAGEPLAGGLWTRARKKAFVDSRVDTTAAVVALIRRLPAKPATLISGSAIGFYGERGDETLEEHSGPAPGFMSELCQRWEDAAMQAEALGTRVCLLRTGLVLGAGGGLLAPLLLSSRFGLGAVLGDGRQWMSWIHIDDEVGLILYLLDHPTLKGAVNATAPSPVRQAELMQVLATRLHRPQWLRVPEPLLRLAGEMSVLFLISQRVLPKTALIAGYSFIHPELMPAIRSIV